MQSNQVRIIGGKWRGRKLSFPSVPGLRPTPDRVRETVFNWLMHPVMNARCLDLFAGSGALGLEALSRGASEVVFVDKSAEAIAALKKNKEKLDCDTMRIIHSSANDYIASCPGPFDIIFLDPPFDADMIEPICSLLEAHAILKPNAYIYLESNCDIKQHKVPQNWHLHKCKKTGRIWNGLFIRKS